MPTRRDILSQVLAIAATGTALKTPTLISPLMAQEAALPPQQMPALNVHLPLWYQGDLDPAAYWPPLFAALKSIGIHHCHLLLYRFVDPLTGQISSNSHYKNAPAPSLDFLEGAMKAAEAQQMQASLYPMLEIDNNKNIGTVWRGYLNFFGVTLKNFFEQYNELIMTLAALSTQYKASTLFIGTELASLTHNLSARPHWEELIHQAGRHIKASGTGEQTRLTYAAHWEEYLTVPFWRQLDDIAINAYFPLVDQETAKGPNKPHLKELKTGWLTNLEILKNFAAQHHRPLMISEFGLTPYDMAASRPWDQQPSEERDEHEQINAYKIFFELLKEEGQWLKSVSLWHWKMPDRKGSSYNIENNGPIIELIKAYARSANR